MNFTSYCTVHLIQNLEPNSLPVLAMKGSITLYVRLDCTRFIYGNLTFSDDLPNSYFCAYVETVYPIEKNAMRKFLIFNLYFHV